MQLEKKKKEHLYTFGRVSICCPGNTVTVSGGVTLISKTVHEKIKQRTSRMSKCIIPWIAK